MIESVPDPKPEKKRRALRENARYPEQFEIMIGLLREILKALVSLLELARRGSSQPDSPAKAAIVAPDADYFRSADQTPPPKAIQAIPTQPEPRVPFMIGRRVGYAHDPSIRGIIIQNPRVYEDPNSPKVCVRWLEPPEIAQHLNDLDKKGRWEWVADLVIIDHA